MDVPRRQESPDGRIERSLGGPVPRQDVAEHPAKTRRGEPGLSDRLMVERRNGTRRAPCAEFRFGVFELCERRFKGWEASRVGVGVGREDGSSPHEVHIARDENCCTVVRGQYRPACQREQRARSHATSRRARAGLRRASLTLITRCAT